MSTNNHDTISTLLGLICELRDIVEYNRHIIPVDTDGLLGRVAWATNDASEIVSPPTTGWRAK